MTGIDPETMDRWIGVYVGALRSMIDDETGEPIVGTLLHDIATSNEGYRAALGARLVALAMALLDIDEETADQLVAVATEQMEFVAEAIVEMDELTDGS